MRKSLIFAIASILMLMISCSKEQPTKVSEYVFDKRNIDNDTNWVEFHDYDTLDGLCFDFWDAYGGMILDSEEEYKESYIKSINQESKILSCSFGTIDDYIKPDIDFDKKSLYIVTWSDGMVEYHSKLYYNTKKDEYFYLLTVELIAEGMIFKAHVETISLPKITNNEKITFDTLYNINWK
jgi:hypothetical protein